MAVTYNAEEIYRIGVEIERNGRRFYEDAAKAAADSDLKRLLTDLAGWEASHVKLFEDLQAALPKAATSGDAFDPDGDVQRYLKAAADSHVFLQASLDIPALVRACRGARDVLAMALRFEKDSVVLYTVMRDLVPKRLGQKTVERLLHEEIAHVSMIQERLAALGTQ